MGRLRARILRRGLGLPLLVVLALAVPLGSVSAQRLLNLVWAYERGPAEIDPHDTRGTPDSEIAMFMTHNSLLRWTTKNQTLVEPDLAKSYKMSNGGRTYTFTLRDDVSFWDNWGQMTSEDVVFSINRLLRDTKLRHNSVLTSAVDSARAIDKFTLEINLKQPHAAFLTTIAAHLSTAVVSRKAYEQMGPERFRLEPIGTGPYKPVNWRPGEGVGFVANPKYFRGEPEIKRVTLIAQPDETSAALALQKGEVNFVVVRGPSMYQALRNATGIRFEQDPNISTNLLMFWLNNARAPLSDPRVRRALIMGLDRQAMMQTLGQGMSGGLAHSILPKSLFGHTDDVRKFQYDPEGARALLREAGVGDGVELVAITHRSGVYVPALEAAQAYWARIGVRLRIDVVERLARDARLRAGDFHLGVFDIGRIEPHEFLSEFFHSKAIPPAGRAYSFYRNPRYDALVDAQAVERDRGRRKIFIIEAQRMLADDVAFVPLWYLVNVTARSDYLEGTLPNLYTWNTRFSDLKVRR